MSVIHIERNVDRLVLTITAEFAAPVEHVWQMWADPRRLEQWWGPPTYPATFVEHDLVPGGRVHYYMSWTYFAQSHKVVRAEAARRASATAKMSSASSLYFETS